MNQDNENCDVDLDSYHYHEAVDRLHCIVDRIQWDVIDHPVCQKHPELKQMVDEATEKLASAYQLATNLDESLWQDNNTEGKQNE